jgi:DNA polymerase-3 subunit delta'
VRVLQGFLRLTPAEGGWRVVVVDEAERLNRNAANALLKLLEEPPPRSVILLSCNAPGRLPVTLRSRCRLLRLSPLGLSDIQSVLDRLLPGMPADDRERVARLADGSPGRAVALAQDDGLALAALAETVLRAIPEAASRHAFPVADRLSRADAPFGAFMDQLCGALDRATRAHARGVGVAATWVSRRPLSEWAEVWHALVHLRDETERLHLDRRQAILDAFALLDGQ